MQFTKRGLKKKQYSVLFYSVDREFGTVDHRELNVWYRPVHIVDKNEKKTTISIVASQQRICHLYSRQLAAECQVEM